MACNRDDPLALLNNPITSSPPIASSEGESYLHDTSQIGSASGSFQNEGFLGSIDATGPSDADFGFSRPDFRQGPLVGTVELYHRHVFLCYKNPQVWPPRVEAAEFDRLPRLLSAVLSSRKADMKKQIRLTICEGRDGTETSNGDVLIFPDMIRYRRLTHFDVDTFVEEVLVKEGEWLPGSPEALHGWYIFVCCHGTRDRRCGVCGPAVVSRFREEIEFSGRQGKVSVSPCSHIGGHKYAGNVIIFGPGINKKVTGHWYGYVTPDDVPTLIEQHVGKKEIVDWLWRGQMGLSEEEQKISQEIRLRNNSTNSSNNLNPTNETSAGQCGSQPEGAGCCQANGGFPCCQNTTLERKSSSELSEADKFKSERKSLRRKLSRNNSGKVISSRKVSSVPTWLESWEREDTYAALAVVGAIASVAFAYSCYKKSR